ncbi:ATP-binding protein [Fictibacillus sp. NRS-1165]|uniref:ATP-binding protein n=1 Tax=Fictibacillus sp. NRS-1165 TaxID=3144463 RepID=UPI003D23D1A7
MVEQFLVKMMKMQKPFERPQGDDSQIHTLELSPVHLFRIKRKAAGNYVVTHSEGKLPNDTKLHAAAAERPLSDLIPLKTIQHWTAYLERAFSGRPCIFETHDMERSFQTVLTPMFQDEQVIEVAGTSTDCTLETRSQEELILYAHKYKEIFNHTLNPILLLNNSRLILEANAAALEALGIPRRDMNLNRLDSFICKEDEGELSLNWDLFMLDPSLKWEFKAVLGEEKRLMECTGKKDILPGVHLCILQDVTDRRQTEERLRKAETLNVVGEMAAGVAHEIRNPLTSLKGFIQLLQNESKAHEAYYSIILNEVDRIEYIIKEFLLLAKTDRQHIEKSSLVVTLKETVSLLQTQAILKNIELEVEIEENIPDIDCDPFQIKQVFINLIKNGIEATDEGGTIFIKAFRTEKNQVHFCFTDNGSGMPNQVLDRIGKPFYTTKEEGTGLGLMVSYKIIENHKGTVRVSSEVGKGTTFEVILPI